MPNAKVTIVVVGDTVEATRIRELLAEQGANIIDPSVAYLERSYAAVFLTDEPVFRRTRKNRGRNQRYCRIQRSAMGLREVGMREIPPCITGATGIVAFSRALVRAPAHPDTLPGLKNAAREVVRMCTRYRNFMLDKELQDAALERRNQVRRARAAAVA